MCKLYAPYIRHLSILEFGRLWGILESIPHTYRGITVYCIHFKKKNDKKALRCKEVSKETSKETGNVLANLNKNHLISKHPIYGGREGVNLTF